MSVDIKTVLVTGGCGFIGHHFVEYVMKKTNWNIIVIDMLNYASKGFDRLRDNNTFYSPRVKCLSHNLCNPLTEGLIREIGPDVNYIVHMGAETHVDNSIKRPIEVIQNNVMSTVNILEYARTLEHLQLFFYFSTDEVFGPALGESMYKEWDRHHPTNPYSASKAAAEDICLGYENTYKVPLMIVNVMNAFGERQHVEKFIPLCIKRILNGEKIMIHSYPDKKRSGTRFYIHAQNIAGAVLFLIEHGTIGEKYNIRGEKEVGNLELAQQIAKIMDKELIYEMVDFHSDRPGHDLRYGLDGTKLKEMGWSVKVPFDESLERTVKWTLQHLQWLEP
jgi:dTDP-glucose 4,6-dehydratase